MKKKFKYWFEHWCAVQLTALRLNCWSPRYLLHDIEKPWLYMVYRDSNKVSAHHRRNSSHHPRGHKYRYKTDWEQMVVDWESARLTKPDKPLNARETLYKIYPEYKQYVLPVLNKLGL